MFGHKAQTGVRTGLLQTGTCNLVQRFPVKKAQASDRPTAKRD